MNGLITVITGPMFAGKTKKLIEYYQNLKKSNKKILAFKPVIDKRYSQTEIVSHDNDKIPALAVKEVKEISQFLNQDTEVILIDEVQLFFSDEMVGFFDNLAKEGKEVIATSLDWDCFNDIPISWVVGLLATADEVIKLRGICDVCGDKAVKNQWKMDYLPKKPEDCVGEAEKYGSYCRWHYVPINKLKKISQRYNRVKGENARAVIWKDEKFLMVYDIGKGWNLPGGTIDKGETPFECAIREIKEETNLTINDLELLCTEWIYYRDKWWKTHIFETNNFSGKIIKQNSEVSDIKFFTCQQAQEQKSEAIATFLPHLIKSMKRRNDKYE